MLGNLVSTLVHFCVMRDGTKSKDTKVSGIVKFHHLTSAPGQAKRQEPLRCLERRQQLVKSLGGVHRRRRRPLATASLRSGEKLLDLI